ncbi:MAG: alpha/beta hydrolase [Bdellovibrio sp.]|nr:alpha/beta hydrolase [Bdellovibrio sp.]
MELYCHQWGKPNNNKRILFLHGLGGTGAVWRPIAQSLEDKYRILAPDQRGHGKSQIIHIPGGRIKPNYSPLDYGSDLVNTLEKHQFYPTYVIGHSMGVRSACALAHIKPDWIDGIILIDLSLSLSKEKTLESSLVQFLTQLPMQFRTRKEAKTYLETNSPDPSVKQYLLAVSITNDTGQITFPFDKQAIIQTLNAVQQYAFSAWSAQVVEELGKKNKPIMILRGAHSGVFTSAMFQHDKEYFKRYSSIHFKEFQDTGHGLPFEKRLEFLEVIKKFMKEA